LNRYDRRASSLQGHDGQLTDSEGVQYPKDILPFKHKYVWRSKLDLNIVCPGRTLQRLISLTGCVMVKSLNEGEIFIGAALEENIHLAITKLDNLTQYAVSSLIRHRFFSTNLIKELQPEFIGHSFYTEETATYELSLQRLYDVKITGKRKIFETTLIDCLDILYDKYNDKTKLEKFVTVRCATHVPERGNFTAVKTKVPTINQQLDFSEIRNDWKGFPCAGKGDPSSNPLRHFPTEEMNRIEQSQVSNVKPPPAVKPEVFANPDQVAKVEQWKEEAKADVAQGFVVPPPKRRLHSLSSFVHNTDPVYSSQVCETGLGPV
jgi:hypothetical protein